MGKGVAVKELGDRERGEGTGKGGICPGWTNDCLWIERRET